MNAMLAVTVVMQNLPPTKLGRIAYYFAHISPFFIPIEIAILIFGIIATKGHSLIKRTCRIGLTMLFVLRAYEWPNIIGLFFIICAAMLWVPRFCDGGAHVFIKLIDDWDIHIPTNMNRERNRLSRLIRKGKMEKAHDLARRLKRRGHDPEFIDTMFSILPKNQQISSGNKIVLKGLRT